MSITSDEVNYLIYRYMQESGFVHSSFAFGHESHILKNDFKNVKVSPGALINLLQKGLLYTEAEMHVNEDGTEKECLRPFSLLQTHECEKPSSSNNASKRQKREETNRRKDEKKKLKKQKQQQTQQQANDGEEDKMDVDVDGDESTFNRGRIPSKATMEISRSEVLLLTGHQSDVFVCQWNPKRSIIASGAGDATVRLWDVPTEPLSTVKGNLTQTAILKQYKDGDNKTDVTCVSWNNDGTLLATGSFGGEVRLWTESGQLKYYLIKHAGPVFSLKWNKTGSSLLSAGVDKNAIVWDPTTGERRQLFENHRAAILDVDWKDDEVFASCSTDRSIFVCRVGDSKYIKRFDGHANEVNSVRWDPEGKLLASCSDDHTAKVWSMDSDHPILDLKGHEKEIYTLTWSPTGPGTQNPNLKRILATHRASFDHTVKLWDVTTGKCIHDLSNFHSEAVYSISFSPDGRYLASGSFDSQIAVWNVSDGSLVRTYKGGAGNFEVHWNPAGDRLVACFGDNKLAVMEIRLPSMYL